MKKGKFDILIKSSMSWIITLTIVIFLILFFAAYRDFNDKANNKLNPVEYFVKVVSNNFSDKEICK